MRLAAACLLAVACADPCAWQPTGWELPNAEPEDAGTCWVIVAADGCGWLEPDDACQEPHHCGVVWPGRQLDYVCRAEPVPFGVHRGFPCSLGDRPEAHYCDALRILAAGQTVIEGEP